jgi:hypothetical protein
VNDVIEQADVIAWHCGAPGCTERPILAVYSLLGGVRVRLRRAGRGLPAEYTIDLHEPYLDARCRSCGSWRRLAIGINGQISQSARPEYPTGAAEDEHRARAAVG